MKILLFGATGMIGAGTLRVLVESPEVESILAIGRRACDVRHPKLRELILSDLHEHAGIEVQLAGFDACIWAVGISSVGLEESADINRIGA